MFHSNLVHFYVFVAKPFLDNICWCSNWFGNNFCSTRGATSPVCLSVWLCLYVCLSINLSTYLLVCICLSVCVSVYQSIYISACIAIFVCLTFCTALATLSLQLLGLNTTIINILKLFPYKVDWGDLFHRFWNLLITGDVPSFSKINKFNN